MIYTLFNNLCLSVFKYTNIMLYLILIAFSFTGLFYFQNDTVRFISLFVMYSNVFIVYLYDAVGSFENLECDINKAKTKLTDYEFCKKLIWTICSSMGIFYIIGFYWSWYFITTIFLCNNALLLYIMYIIITTLCIIHCVTYYNYYKHFMMNNKTNYSSYLNYINNNRSNIYINYEDYLLNEHIWNFNDEKQDEHIHHSCDAQTELNNYIEYK